MHGIWKTAGVVTCVLGLSACASIVGGRYQRINVDAKSDGASIVGANCMLRNDKANVNVSIPGTAVMHRSSGALDVTCTKDGQQVAQQVYPSHVRGMVWGNLVFGGIIGIIIDFSNSAARHYPNDLNLIATAGSASVRTMPMQVAPPVVDGGTASPTPAYAAQPGGPASLDPRVSVPMFNSAQDIASIAQCDRMIRVEQVEGDHGSFFSQCPAGRKVLHIECTGAHCEPTS